MVTIFFDVCCKNYPIFEILSPTILANSDMNNYYEIPSRKQTSQEAENKLCTAKMLGSE